MIAVTAVVVAYGSEPCLERSVEALLRSEDVLVEVILVDNGCTDGAVDRLDGTPRLSVLRPGENLGFAAGSNLGAAAARGQVIALVNPDAVVEAGALAYMASAALRPGIGIASASIRLSTDPTLLNSAGNVVHFLGMSWAGCLGEPASAHSREREVGAASGAAMAVRTETWHRLGGFDEVYFAYVEDTDLSLRAMQRGYRVVYVPEARVVHRYEFARHPEKLYLLERNRAIYVLTLYSGRALLLLAPALLAFELAVLVVAATQGWLPQKLRAISWLWRNRKRLKEIRSRRQTERVVSDRYALSMHTGRLDPRQVAVPALFKPVDLGLSGLWAVVRRLL